MVLAASLVAYRAHADIAMVAANFVFTRHGSILSPYACSSAMIV
jgi:hypothetical protein